MTRTYPGVGSHDPTTFIGVAGFLLIVASLRILRLEPAKALRE
ncbi:MAG TPA: hypothetical protein VMV37_10770 [Gammaproteobacteria bacterium]|nr:hypothetical protein [Gammaproteobacteria bacterium]